MASEDASESGTILELMATERRRTIVWLLAAQGACELGTLAAFIVAVEGNGLDAARDAEPVRRVRNNLRHRHVDQLAAAGVIERSADGITPGPHFVVALRTLTASRSE